jgi:phthalate 4,5-dioxygenase oxygenase subunit
VRTTLFIAPFTVQIPPNNRYKVAILHVPMDDERTAFHFIAWGGDATPETETWRQFIGAQVGVDVDREYRKTRTRANNYLQDRASMRLGNFTGIRGIPNQDIAMWETMGPIADRTRERLGASDVAVVAFRRRMIEAARRFQATGEAIGRSGDLTPPSKLRSFEGIVPKSTDWRNLSGAGPVSGALESSAPGVAAE